ncbi:MAG: hypothetical protein D6820_03265, partial [Lentisphaerae bacterium]
MQQNNNRVMMIRAILFALLVCSRITAEERIELTKGPNAIALPFLPATSNVYDMFAEIMDHVGLVLQFDAKKQNWRVFAPRAPFTSDLETIAMGQPFFVRVSETCQLNLIRHQNPQDKHPKLFRVKLVKGWNSLCVKEKVTLRQLTDIHDDSFKFGTIQLDQIQLWQNDAEPGKLPAYSKIDDPDLDLVPNKVYWLHFQPTEQGQSSTKKSIASSQQQKNTSHTTVTACTKYTRKQLTSDPYDDYVLKKDRHGTPTERIIKLGEIGILIADQDISRDASG